VSGDPSRTSFELQLNSYAAIWLSDARLAGAQRTVRRGLPPIILRKLPAVTTNVTLEKSVSRV
jgi:hypothetical protein